MYMYACMIWHDHKWFTTETKCKTSSQPVFNIILRSYNLQTITHKTYTKFKYQINNNLKSGMQTAVLTYSSAVLVLGIAGLGYFGFPFIWRLQGCNSWFWESQHGTLLFIIFVSSESSDTANLRFESHNIVSPLPLSINLNATVLLAKAVALHIAP